MRYFKWGVARLILEPDVCPDIVPMWIEGNDQVMHESRPFPRFLPRINQNCGVWFGQNVGGDGDNVFQDLRRKWRKLVEEKTRHSAEKLKIGVLNEELKFGDEAVQLREECTRHVREAVLHVRRMRGLPDEDPKDGLIETWREEGSKHEGKMEDGSWVNDSWS
jgi:monolysocardiolipin acyltransferase